MNIGKMSLVLLILTSLLYADVYLPKSVQLEQYLISAKRYEKSGNYTKATKEFKKIERLQEELPVEFYFLYARNLFRSANYEEAKVYFKRYLQRVQRGDVYYFDALDYLGRIDEKSEDKSLQDKECKALPKKIKEALDNCDSLCRDSVNIQINRDMYKYRNYTTSEMFRRWFPECMSACKKKKYNSLRSSYQQRCK